MKQQGYLKNAAILTLTGIFLRAAGMIFRVYLASEIGAEGMGLYQLVFTIYTLAITLATGGLSILATRVATDIITINPKSILSAMKRVLLLSSVLGIAAMLFLFLFAKPASLFWLHDERATMPLLILAPSLPPMAISASLRGYFMARQRVTPNAKAQIMEQIIRLALVALIIGNSLDYGVQVACCAVVLGNTVSEIASWLYMCRCFKKDIIPLDGKSPAPKLNLLHILVPTASTGYVSTVLRTIENVMVPTSLALYTHNHETALAQYGALKGMAMPVMFFPFSFIATLATLLLPEITRAHLKKEKKTLEYLINRVMLITCIFSVIAAGIFTMFSYDIGRLLYKSDEIGFYIAILGPLTPVMYVESMVDGILKGLDEQMATFRYSVADSAMRIVLIFFILPKYGMNGFLVVMLISNLFTSFLNVYRLFKVTKMKFNFYAWLVKPCAALSLCALLKRFVLYPLFGEGCSQIIWVVLGAFCVGLAYMIFLWLFKGFTKYDFLPASRNKQKNTV